MSDETANIEIDSHTLEYMANNPSERATARPVKLPKQPKQPTRDWMARHEAALDFATVHGHLQVSPKTTWNEVIIGDWVRNHRVKDRKDKLTPVKRELVERIPHWNPNPGTEIHDWDGKFEIMKRAVETFGLEALLLSAEFFGLATGKWAKSQRDRRRKGKLTPEQIAKLNSIRGWVWNIDTAKRKAANQQKSSRKKAAQKEKGSPRKQPAFSAAPRKSLKNTTSKGVISAIGGNGQPTRDASVTISPDIEPADLGRLQDPLLDHLRVGGQRLVPDARCDQFMIIAWHSPTTNVITIEWANPSQIIQDGERLTPAEAYQMTHPTKRAGYYDWQSQEFLDDDEEEEGED